MSYKVSVDRHAQALSRVPSLAETRLPILRFLTRCGGLECLGVEPDSAELYLLVTKHLALPQSVPRIPSTTTTLPQTTVPDRWVVQNNTNGPIITR